MQLTTSKVPAIWVLSTGDAFNANPAAGYPAFLSPSQAARLERIRQARMLFDGQHRDYFLGERRTQFDFPTSMVGDRQIQMYLKYNALGLVAQKITDLLFGDAPEVRVPLPQQQAALEGLVERSNLHPLLYGKALDAAYEGEAFVEACAYGGEVYLRGIPADEVFPVGPVMPDGQYRQYVRYSLRNVGTERVPVLLLLALTYSPGLIERACFQLDEGGKLDHRLDLSAWSAGADAPVVSAASLAAQPGTGPAPVTPTAANSDAMASVADPFGDDELVDRTVTGVPRNLITWLPNQLVRGRPVSDFDIALDLQDTLNAKQTQLARAIQKHADPKLAMPQRAANSFGSAYAADEVFFFGTPDEIPKYITWNAELAAAQSDRDFALYNLLVATETSPVLLALKEGHANDAFKKVKVQSMTSQKKAARKAAFWKPAIKRMIGVAQDLENAMLGGRYDRGPVGVTMQDGIPQDELDQANQISTLRGAGVMSKRRGVELQITDPAAVEAELRELAKDDAAATPSIFMGRPMPGGPAGVAAVLADAGTEDAAGLADEEAEVAA